MCKANSNSYYFTYCKYNVFEKALQQKSNVIRCLKKNFFQTVVSCLPLTLAVCCIQVKAPYIRVQQSFDAQLDGIYKGFVLQHVLLQEVGIYSVHPSVSSMVNLLLYYILSKPWAIADNTIISRFLYLC